MSRRKNTARKGYSFERELKNQLRDAGVEMRRQPGSGAVGTRANESRLQGDGLIDPWGWAKKVECKFYENPPNFKRLEQHRMEVDVLYVDTPAGRFVWTSVDFFCEQLGRAYTNPGIVPHDFAILKAGSAFKQFDAWMKGCDLLAVKKNLCGACVWMPYPLWLDLLACAAQGAFLPEPYDGPYTEENAA